MGLPALYLEGRCFQDGGRDSKLTCHPSERPSATSPLRRLPANLHGSMLLPPSLSLFQLVTKYLFSRLLSVPLSSLGVLGYLEQC